MKKIISVILCMVLCAALATAMVSAEEYGAISLLPDPDGEMTAVGCDVAVNGNGSVTITLTEASATVDMLFQKGQTVYVEAYSEIANYPLVAYWFESEDGVQVTDIHAHYLRKDKGETGADLYLSGMRNNPAYLEVGDATTNYGAWSIYDYLSKGKGADYATGDYAVLKFLDIHYAFSGNVGDTITFYAFGTMADVYDGFGTEIPEDVSDEPIIIVPESSEEPSEEPSEESKPVSKPESKEESKETPVTADNGIVALAVVASIAVAAVVVTRKAR